MKATDITTLGLCEALLGIWREAHLNYDYEDDMVDDMLALITQRLRQLESEIRRDMRQALSALSDN
jgi:hypothetical protein